MTVSLLEIMAAARSHAAPLAAESAGYLLLAVADHVVAAPRLVTPDDVELLLDGSVRLRSRPAPDSSRAEQVVRRLLRRTLEVSSSVGPGLRRAAERTEDTGLAALVRELEVALIPVNRGAAKRALSRLHRETERARHAGKLTALLAAESVTSELEVAPAPSPPRTEAAPSAPAPSPVVASHPAPEALEPSPVALPAVVAVAPPPAVPARPAAALDLTLTPPPRGEPAPALTKPEPVVLRAKERGNSTPRLGTVVTAQTLLGEETELTERAPTVTVADDEPEPAAELQLEVELQLDVDLDLELAAETDFSDEELTPVRAIATAPQPLDDPEPSQLPDVVAAMLELHTGIDADDAPTRLREVVTELLAIVQPVPLLTPEPQQVEDAWLTQSSIDEVATSASPFEDETPPLEAEVVDPALYEAATWNPAPVAPIPVPVAAELAPAPAPAPEPTPAPEPLVVYRFESEQLDPAQHEALTWYPAPVTSDPTPLPAALLVVEAMPELSPYAPAVLPAQSHQVSELVDSFYVSGGSEDTELRSALKEMAGIELTPMPHRLIDDR